ncbi:hypothetical protein L2E69_22360 [Planktothrix agardhii 1806]|uniref:PIN domain-containing protein n=1 Tax=Planktothrix agardhii (strain NIVA-CYA 126/8) TaxID=388467 RepID=A0A073CME6_PLAA1|nr:type II toxin-antitoxin system VapC family toxin [Planktothrix agardhii]KEI65160.1 hypothetical protein A19Y_8070 [Planktothrix agardhii NIVA-CYA 126/8]MCF3573576.1 hypothetical protein [Planktothrix agardhii 1805]MCF3587542.1 hypothetical protein [Planktothrix agardhii 1803]MCF3605064.1 hypothetical protein [Planktothrix agardhii 1804]MCF3618661.1 hypothetical protein [Planktothrix agardhii 1806]
MSAIVADTHAIVWYFRSPEKLAYDASIAFDHAVNNGYPVHISAISQDKKFRCNSNYLG